MIFLLTVFSRNLVMFQFKLIGNSNLSLVNKWISGRPELPWKIETIDGDIHVVSISSDATPDQISYSLNELLKQLEKCGYNCPGAQAARNYWWQKYE